MPTFSFRRPQFLRLHRSASPPLDPSMMCPRDEQDANVAANTSHPAAIGNITLPSNCTERLRVDRTLGDLNKGPSRASRPVSRTDIVGLTLEQMSSPAGEHSLQPRHQHQGLFNQAHNFTVMGTFTESNVTYNNTTSKSFMEKFLEKTMPGAEFDSSDRDPPPRCHPGTRLAILDRCLHFIRSCEGQKKTLWIVGAAGVGKSAVMQNVSESTQLPVSLHASVFFSINGCNDGAKTIVTISYQLAAKSEQYRQLVEEEINRDPSLFRSSVDKQFKKLIIEPFLHPQLNSAGRVLIIIDGLDECNNSRAQLDLVRLISHFCITYPSSPLVWLIASRPETHITSFFSRVEVMPAYEKEEMLVDSDEGRADVERFLREELMEIKKTSDSLGPQWPEERDLWKLANASGGLFAYAQTVMRYIGDMNIGSPASQLSDVLNVIDNRPMTDVPRDDHPMASLDALYARILSNTQPKFMVQTRKILLALGSTWDGQLHCGGSFIVLCNWLGMTPDEAYAAVNHLRSVLYVPRRDQAHREILKPFHKSFIDYLHDFTRSRFSRDLKHDARQLNTECTFRIFKEAPDGVDFGDVDYEVYGGRLLRGPGTGDKISLTWPADRGVDWDDNETRLRLYKLAIGAVENGVKRGISTFQDKFCIRLLTTRFQYVGPSFPRDELRDFVFDESRRHEFTMDGILKQMILQEAGDITGPSAYVQVKMQFRRPGPVMPNLSDPWCSSWKHKRKGVWENEREQDWTTTFSRSQCPFCYNRLVLQWDSWKKRSHDHSLPILFSSTGGRCVEFRFVDPEDGVSEWSYWFWCLEERKQHGTALYCMT